MFALPGRYEISFRPIEGSDQTQYIPGKVDRNEAGRYGVTVDTETVVDETVLPTGSLSGRFTGASGAPLGPVHVWTGSADAWSDEAGAFTFPTLLAGSYKIRYSTGDREQYHRGTLDHGSADAVVVRGGEQTSLEDSLLGTGSVRISAVDSVTGEPVPDFCVNSEYTGGVACSDGTGQATLAELPQGRHDLHLYAPDKLHFAGRSSTSG